MIEMPARVTRVENDAAWVCVESPESCGACGGHGCGSSLYARMLHPREPEYPVENFIAARPGEHVVVGIEDGSILKAVCWGYLMPLVLLIVGAILGSTWGEAYGVLGSVVGMLIATAWLRTRRGNAQPTILRRGSTVCDARPS